MLEPGRCTGAWSKNYVHVCSNYAPTITVQKEAEKHGCQQVLWLFGEDHLITEVGTMNIFVFWINEEGGKAEDFRRNPAGVQSSHYYRERTSDAAVRWPYSARSHAKKLTGSGAQMG